MTLSEFEASLPPAPVPVGSYVPVVQVGNLVYTSGVLPTKSGQLAYSGAVGTEAISVDDAQQAARLCAINALSLLKGHLGSLSRIKRVVKVAGFVSSDPTFYQQPAVINGASDLLVEVFGDVGKHARSAVGVAALPLNAPVEIELIVEVDSTPDATAS
jgi:enamine deaminase RidA (YjgF/YER057c/UK114 family)